jgi:hypothetical protein
MWDRAAEIKFLEAHPNADEIVVEKHTGHIVGVVYRTPYGVALGETRAFLYAAGAVSEDDDGLALIGATEGES